MLPDNHTVIRNANRIWQMMYYDELIEKREYQLSLVYNADRDYYNCAHDVNNLNAKNLLKIQKYFHKNNVPTSIYIEPCTQTYMIPKLLRAGYKLVKEEQENWYFFDLFQLDKLPREEEYLKISPERILYRQVSPADSASFDEFLQVNSTVNNIPNHLIKRLKNKANQYIDAKVMKNYYYLASIDRKPVTTGTIGLIERMGFLAEGATLVAFRRKGIFSSMMRHMLSFSKTQGCRYVFVNCDSTAFSNQACLKFGFKFYFQRDLYKLNHV